MEVKIVNNDIGLIKPKGDIDVRIASEFVEHITDLLDKRIVNLILDLSQTEFISSSGIGTIAIASKDVRRYKGRFVIVCHEIRLLSLFEITNLDKIITIFSSLEDAESSFSQLP